MTWLEFFLVCLWLWTLAGLITAIVLIKKDHNSYERNFYNVTKFFDLLLEMFDNHEKHLELIDKLLEEYHGWLTDLSEATIGILEETWLIEDEDEDSEEKKNWKIMEEELKKVANPKKKTKKSSKKN